MSEKYTFFDLKRDVEGIYHGPDGRMFMRRGKRFFVIPDEKALHRIIDRSFYVTAIFVLSFPAFLALYVAVPDTMLVPLYIVMGLFYLFFFLPISGDWLTRGYEETMEFSMPSSEIALLHRMKQTRERPGPLNAIAVLLLVMAAFTGYQAHNIYDKNKPEIPRGGYELSLSEDAYQSKNIYRADRTKIAIEDKRSAVYGMSGLSFLFLLGAFMFFWIAGVAKRAQLMGDDYKNMPPNSRDNVPPTVQR